MGLTPDEIAHRAFTPSADGYHQGEVRLFLERIAAELRGLQSAMPEGRAELAELMSAVHDQAPRLTSLERQLTSMLSDLGAAAEQIRSTHDATTAQLDRAERTSAEQRAIVERLSTEHESVAAQLTLAHKLTAEQREAAERLADAGERSVLQLSAAQEIAAEQRYAAERLAAAGERSAAQLAAAQELTARQQETAQRLSSAGDLAGERLTATATAAAATTSPAPDPAHSANLRRSYTDPVSGRPPANAAAAAQSSDLFASDLDDQPLFSDSANDLLDSVLDDVMGTITDEESPS